MISDAEHAEWLAHPTGKIAKGEYCGSCGRFNARPCAANAVVLDGDKVLLVQRGQEPDKGFWDIPGGYLDWDETLEQCAARELKEETSLVVNPNNFRLFTIFSDPDNKAQNQVVDMYFVATEFSGDLEIDGIEVTAARWFSLKDLPHTVAFDHMVMFHKLRTELGYSD